jgi:hypothetical protein
MSQTPSLSMTLFAAAVPWRRLGRVFPIAAGDT